MSSFFYGIEDLFVNYLFWPLDQLRYMESWWGANAINWMFILIGSAAMAYWLLQLKKYDDTGDENTKSVATTWPYE